MAMGDTLICFSCCLTEQPQPKRRRRIIDRTMIGLPTDFRHTGHIGSSEVGNAIQLHSMETQMCSKGGYEKVSPVNVKLSVIDLPDKRLS